MQESRLLLGTLTLIYEKHKQHNLYKHMIASAPSSVYNISTYFDSTLECEKHV